MLRYALFACGGFVLGCVAGVSGVAILDSVTPSEPTYTVRISAQPAGVSVGSPMLNVGWTDIRGDHEYRIIWTARDLGVNELQALGIIVIATSTGPGSMPSFLSDLSQPDNMSPHFAVALGHGGTSGEYFPRLGLIIVRVDSE